MKNVFVILIGFFILSQSFVENKIFVSNSNETTFSGADTLKRDAETGLVIDKDLYMVKAQCTSCHSSKLIIANHFTRDGWKQKIRWMQANHNLWDLGETEKQVLDYLEKYHAPTQAVARRQPIKNIQWYKLDVK